MAVTLKTRKEAETLVASCIELLEAEIGNLHYPDEESTHLCTIARQVAELLIEVDVKDKAALVAASLGDLPYTVKTWREKVNLCKLAYSISILYSVAPLLRRTK